MSREVLVGGVFLLLSVAWSPTVGEEAAFPSLDLRLEGWEPAGPTETYVGEKLYEAIDGFADYHFGFDFREAQRRFFIQGQKKIEVFVYRFGSPTEAYGLYSVMRPRWGQPVPVGDEAVWEEGNVCAVWRGPYYIAVTTQGAEVASEEDLIGAARAVAQQIGGEFKRPDLVEILPPGRLQPLSVLYFHCLQPLDRVFYLGEGNVLQLAEKPTDPHEVEAIYAEYDQRGRPAIVVVVLYPQAEKGRKACELYAAQVGAEAVAATEDSLWDPPEAASYGRDFKAHTGFHTLLFQREKWLLAAAEVVDVDFMKDLLRQVDRALGKRLERQSAQERDSEAKRAEGEGTLKEKDE